MTWSYTALVREHGEERALELLSQQTGYGEFEMGRHLTNRKIANDPRPRSDNLCPLCGEQMSSRQPCGRVA